MPTQDLTLKNTILTLKEYIYELFRKWYVFMVLIGMFLIGAYYYAGTKVITYSADISFMTNEDGGGSAAGLMQLANKFGFGGGGGGGEVKTEKILELLVSKRMVYTALLQTVTINDVTDCLFNHYINEFELRKKWQNKTDLKDFSFTSKNFKDFSFTENKVAQSIYQTIKKEHLSTSNKQSGIMHLRCQSTSENFSQIFIVKLVELLRDYYSNKSVEQQNKTYKIIENRVDSLHKAMRNKEYALAKWIDDYRIPLRVGTLKAEKVLERERLKAEAEILSVMYEEAIKNREMAHMSLLVQTPIIQIIDYPTLPLQPQIYFTPILYAFALIAAIGLAIILISFNKLVKDALREG